MTSTPALMLKFARVLSIVGIDTVMSKLDELEQSAPNTVNKEVEAYIITIVCSQYKTSLSAIRKPRVDGDELIARDMCFVLFDKHLDGMSHQKIADILDKSNTAVSNALKKFSKMDKKIKHEREFVEIYYDLNEKVKSFKKTIEN